MAKLKCSICGSTHLDQGELHPQLFGGRVVFRSSAGGFLGRFLSRISALPEPIAAFCCNTCGHIELYALLKKSTVDSSLEASTETSLSSSP